MANNYASGTFEPHIPSDLITEEFETLADALGVTVNRPNDDGKEVYLFNENYCTSGYIENEGGEKEVSDEDLYAALQDIIRRSEGRLTWISHEQAYSCDKMRRGEFGGSAVFITADDIQYHGTSSWLQRRIAEAESGDTGPDTDDSSVTIGDITEAVNDLIKAAKIVVERWSSGNLAEAVTNLSMVTGWAEKTLEDFGSPVAPQPDINQELLNACIQARAALPDAWAAVQCDTPKEVIDLLNRAIERAEKVDNQAEPISSSRAVTILKDLVEMLSEVEDIEHDQFGCRDSECALCAAKTYLAKMENGDISAPSTYISTWNYHIHGEQTFFDMYEWRQDVANGATSLGYQEWVNHQLEPLLWETDLDGVDAIEVAGCTETDGHVDVTGGEEAQFFSVYTHVPNRGVECICDFNTKDQAVAFAKALAARESLPVYGNCCDIEEDGAK